MPQRKTTAPRRARSAGTSPSRPRSSARRLDARPDTLDFRDRMYVPTLVEVPTRIDLKEYRALKVPILDQGREGACTGFGLATVAHFLLRRRRVVPDKTEVSPWMLYGMARRYDEWAGENYEGSSARGAMKGWHKHGVCGLTLWPAADGKGRQSFGRKEAADASTRPLGAYFRVNHKDLVALHSALAEVGILYATARVHAGWDRVKADGVIPRSRSMTGGHAFAIVAFDAEGFWIQNSWGPGWGAGGFGRISYDDWLEHGDDVWVARLGAPVRVGPEQTQATRGGASEHYGAAADPELRSHLISLGNDGQLRTTGPFGTTAEDLRRILEDDFPRITRRWKRKRLLLYAHGGLVGESSAIQRVADYRDALLQHEVYPLAFIWKTDYWTTVSNILQDALRRRRPEGILDAAKDFMLDRLDDALEPIGRALTGKAQWDEMKENALRATTTAAGGARLALERLAALRGTAAEPELHVVGHSAGSILHAPLVQLLTGKGTIPSGPMEGAEGLGLKIASCTLWAPACTVSLFKETYLPALRQRAIRRFALFTLTDEAERDDNCAQIYHKSLLYLVSDAFEERPRIPLLREGEPILGMERFVRSDPDLAGLFGGAGAQWVVAPNTAKPGLPGASTARHHGDFDDDAPTVQATLARILQASAAEVEFSFRRSASSLRDRRESLPGGARRA